MLCYRCGSHAPDGSESCGACGQKFTSDPALARSTSSASLTPRKPPPLPAEAFAFREGDIVDSRYRIQALIGTGPIGQVYKAFDQELDITVALKAISPKLMQTPEERKSFAREIRLARKFSHQNLVHVHADGTANNWPFFTMQLLEGLTLRRIIDLRREKDERFSLAEVEPILAQIAAALDAAHEVGPHGGVKPENVIVLPDLLKLTDFGLGLALPRQPFIAAQRAKGAHAYFAPEYLAGQEDVDRHIDVFAMGVILGEMLAGVRPEGGQVPELRQTAPHLPAAIEALYRRALNENPLSRHGTAAEFISELSAIVAENPGDDGRGAVDDELSIDAEVTPDAAEVPPPLPPGASGQPTDSTPPPIPEEGARAKPSRTSRGKARKKSSPSLLLIVALGIAISAPLAWLALRHKLLPAATEPVVALTPRASLPEIEPTPAQNAASAAAPVALAPSRPEVVVPPPAPPQAMGATAAHGAAPEGTPPAAATTAIEAPPKSAASEGRQPPHAVDRQAAGKEPKEASASVVAVSKEQKPVKDAAPAVQKPRERKSDEVSASAPAKTASVKPAAKAACPPQMKLIRAGTFKAGTTADDPMRGFGERNIESVSMPAYCIDLYEYPNRRGASPKGGVTYAMAEAACAKEGKRLCTENEWERACKGARNYRFPYGNTFDDEICNTQTPSGRPRDAKSSGESPRCLSSFGVADLAGNLAEWTSSPYNTRGAGKAIKGGAANRPDHASRCSARRNGPVNKADADAYVGFRCCADAK